MPSLPLSPVSFLVTTPLRFVNIFTFLLRYHTTAFPLTIPLQVLFLFYLRRLFTSLPFCRICIFMYKKLFTLPPSFCTFPPQQQDFYWTIFISSVTTLCKAVVSFWIPVFTTFFLRISSTRHVLLHSFLLVVRIFLKIPFFTHIYDLFPCFGSSTLTTLFLAVHFLLAFSKKMLFPVFPTV